MTNEQKAKAVLASQGRAPVMLAGLSDGELADLAAIHGKADIAVLFAAWLDEYRETRKATVDDDADGV